MKKILSLVVVAAMIMAMAITSFAAGATMKTTITETDTDITVTVSVTGVNALTSITSYLVTDDVEYVADSVAYGAEFAGKFEAPLFTDKDDGIKFALDNDSGTVTSAGEVVAITYKVTKVDPSKELSAADFGYSTSTIKQSKIVDASGTVKSNASGLSSFTVAYVDDRTPAAAETVWTAEAPADTSAFEAGFKFKAEDGTEKTEFAGKKLVIFGKGTPAGSLAAGDYSVVIGANEYVGQIAATEYWAIVIVDENGVKVARDSYNYTAKVNGEVAFSGVVNAQ